jgi:hypothetical protein
MVAGEESTPRTRLVTVGGSSRTIVRCHGSFQRAAPDFLKGWCNHATISSRRRGVHSMVVDPRRNAWARAA